ncbi:hypothetical protein [Herpetosiphon geysericola]|uniref:DUF2946 domain-containing protein n=1 Tax=Herpetosiphon geysericola TaxID=70996 RepID=A0A0P6XZJ3_9CHLR|nr:hypothetical protein [Herpetosiphon geysericola]KPL85283.1 hypothetical protein SE18_16520 [Herpetosiphon geysericola]
MLGWLQQQSKMLTWRTLFGWAMVVQLALVCPLGCVIHCWLQHQPMLLNAEAQPASMFVCELMNQADSLPNGTPSGLASNGMGSGLVAMFALLGFWPSLGFGLRSLRRVNWLIQHPLISYQQRLTTPPPR